MKTIGQIARRTAARLVLTTSFALTASCNRGPAGCYDCAERGSSDVRPCACARNTLEGKPMTCSFPRPECACCKVDADCEKGLECRPSVGPMRCFKPGAQQCTSNEGTIFGLP